MKYTFSSRCLICTYLAILAIHVGAATVDVPDNRRAGSYAHVIPQGNVQKLDKVLLDHDCYMTANEAAVGVDVDSQIHIHSAAEAEQLRARLIGSIWPEGIPFAIRPALAGDGKRFSMNLDLSARRLLKSQIKLSIDMGFGIHSIVYVLVPQSSNNKLFLVHDGHADDSYDSDGNLKTKAFVNITNMETVKALLERGYTVAWLQMPLYGDNLEESFPQPPYQSGCAVQCDRHAELFRAFGATSMNPLRFFIEPVIAMVNFALTDGRSSEVEMMGASGGGWTTLLAAAIDTRIRNSSSISGSLPLYLRAGVCGGPSAGDAEQMGHEGQLYSGVTYLDLYILASSGIGRRHVQINNQFDTCCFYGTGLLDYAPLVSQQVVVNKLGSYQYYLDTTFVGHGYDVSVTHRRGPRNNSLIDVILPAFTQEN
jgi:hypothetical protein